MGNFIEEIIEDDIKSGRVDKVVTRFPPEPNGYLHIGHAKAIYIDYLTAEKYGGRFNLRFDDTNPAKEDEEYVNAIVEDVRWLGADVSRVFFASDYFEKMYECALALIAGGDAYVDDQTPEQIKAGRGTLTEPGKESPCRQRSVEENLRLFKEMKEGKVADGARVLRAKIDMKSPNINMRDPVLYRVVHALHHRQGDKWCIYPMYDFAHPLEDAIEGVTHSLCTLEFEDHRPLYDWVVNKCGFTHPPRQYEFARLNIARTIMSKRYLKMLVETGAVDGWDDPRMPTLCGLRRRGYTSASIRRFCELIGVAKANGEVETALLESCIRDELNRTAPRAMAVLEPLKLVITNLSDAYREKVELEINPNDGEAGKRQLDFSNTLYIERDDFAVEPPPKYKRLTPNGTVRLKGAYIVRCSGYERDDNGRVTVVYGEIVAGSRSGEDNGLVKAKGVIHWVDAKTCVDIEIRLYDYLLLPEEGEKKDFEQRMNPFSLQKLTAKGEAMLASAAKLDSFQFLRQGYFCRDCKSETPVFNRVIGLKDGYKPVK